MLRQYYFKAIAVLFLASWVSFLSGGIVVGEEKLMERKGPIVITSSTLSADSTKAVFEGSVVAKTDNLTLKSDKMTVFYSEAGKVEKIEAENNVRLLRGDKVVTSKNAVFLAEEEKIVFTGDPRAVEGENVVSGTRIIYMVKENRSIIENSKVLLRHGE